MYRGVSHAVVLAVIASLAGCTMLPVSRDSAAPAFDGRPRPAEVDPYPNWPLPPTEIEKLILAGNHVRATEAGAGAGTTGAEKVGVYFPAIGQTIDFKWKRMNGTWRPFWGRLDGVNNSPRKEIAAWKIQQLFLDPADYVVPLSLAYAVHVDKTSGHESPTLPDSHCVLGVASVWLKDVTLPDPLADYERFKLDYTYAYYLANFNLLTYLVKHHDGRPGNFLVSKNDARRQVFAIDNGVAFGGIFYNWFAENWNSIRVPALRRQSIDRLRLLSEEDLQGLLGVVAELRLDDGGVYRNVPHGFNLDDDEGIRIEGGVLQLGLTEDEIKDVWKRIEKLIKDVDKGDIALF
jgi:hypothetical protein